MKRLFSAILIDIMSDDIPMYQFNMIKHYAISQIDKEVKRKKKGSHKKATRK